MIKVVSFNDELWASHKSEFMSLESELFASAIQEDERSKFKLMTTPGAIVLVAMNDNEIVGESYALPLTSTALQDDVEKQHFKELMTRYENQNAIYLYSLALKPNLKKTFTIKLLVKALVEKCRHAGYELLISHTKKRSLLNLNRRLGGKQVEVRKNWSGTGEDYYLCETPLSKIDL